MHLLLYKKREAVKLQQQSINISVNEINCQQWREETPSLGFNRKYKLHKNYNSFVKVLISLLP